MEIWIVTVGKYDNKTIVGVATSKEGAELLLYVAWIEADYGKLAREGFDIDGPYTADTVMSYYR